MNRIDKHIGIVVELFTSKTIIVVIMTLFMAGIIGHLHNIFDSWLLAIGAQATVLLLSINAKYLPSLRSKSGADIPILAFIVAVCIAYLLYMDLLRTEPSDTWSSDWWLTVVKATFISALEISYSFLFVARTKDTDFDNRTDDRTDTDVKASDEIVKQFTEDKDKIKSAIFQKLDEQVSSPEELRDVKERHEAFDIATPEVPFNKPKLTK